MIRNTRGEAKTHGLSHPMSGNFNSKRSPTLSPNTLLLPHSSRPTHGDRSIVYTDYTPSVKNTNRLETLRHLQISVS